MYWTSHSGLVSVVVVSSEAVPQLPVFWVLVEVVGALAVISPPVVLPEDSVEAPEDEEEEEEEAEDPPPTQTAGPGMV